MDEILATYEFHLVDRDIKQVKNIINHELYLNAYRSMKEADFKKYMNKFGEWVTTESPYYKSIDTGVYKVHLCGKIYCFSVIARKIS